ncbi:MAG: hypothetical protein RR998_02220 [Oscillospiraceae bacterium]
MGHSLVDKTSAKRLLAWQFGLCLCVYFAANLFLFYKQATVAFYGAYFSDLPEHLGWACYTDSFLNIPSQARVYPLFHLLVRLFSVVFDTEWSGAIPLALCNCASAVLLYYYICRMVKNSEYSVTVFGKKLNLTHAIPGLLTFSLLLASMLILPIKNLAGGEWHAYLGVFTPNPWHNPTYIVARPFAIICFFEFSELFDLHDESFTFPRLALFSSSLLLATFAKPSFAIVFLPVAGIMMLVKLFSKSWRRILLFGIAYIPTFALLAWQYLLIYVQDTKLSGEGGLEFTLGGGWEIFSPCIPLSIVLAGAFGLVVLAFNIKHFRTAPTVYQLGVYIYLCSLAEVYFLYENNYRKAHADLFWGYMYGLFFLLLASVSLLLKQRGEHPKFERASWIVFALHILCGIGYFAWLLTGRFYF